MSDSSPELSRDGEPSAEVPGQVVFGMGPAGMGPSGQAARRAFGWLLAGATGRPTSVRIFDSYLELLDDLGSLTFAWLPPATFVRGQTKHPLTIVRGISRGDGARYRGVLFGRDPEGPSDIRSLQDARVAWVDRDSCAGHLFPRLALQAAGVVPVEVFAEELFLGSHGAVVHAIARGFADVGASYERVDDDGRPLKGGWTEGDQRFRVLLTSEPIPSDVLVAGPSATAREIVGVRRALRGLQRSPEGLDLIHRLFDADGFLDASPADYRIVRDALAAMLT